GRARYPAFSAERALQDRHHQFARDQRQRKPRNSSQRRFIRECRKIHIGSGRRRCCVIALSAFSPFSSCRTPLNPKASTSVIKLSSKEARAIHIKSTNTAAPKSVWFCISPARLPENFTIAAVINGKSSKDSG